VFHRREDRIRAHILLCWLALPLIRVAETETGHTWPKIRTEIDRLHLGMFSGPAGTFAQRTELSQPQKTLLAKLRITEPSRIFDATLSGAGFAPCVDARFPTSSPTIAVRVLIKSRLIKLLSCRNVERATRIELA